jgi:tRNA/rRNA methyltransferase
LDKNTDPHAADRSADSKAFDDLPSADRLTRVRVVLTRTSHPGNIGAAARACKTMGLTQLWLVAPQRFPDDEATARASGATDLLDTARVVPTLADALHSTVAAVALTARARELAAPQVAPREAAGLLMTRADAGEVALVFGNEQSGLSGDEAALCGWLCQIPTNPLYSSLNLAAAVQILAYEMRLATLAGQQLRTAGDAPDPAPFEDVERFHEHLLRVLAELDFYDPANPRRLEPKLRRLFAKAQLERDEVNILRGLLTAIEQGR